LALRGEGFINVYKYLAREREKKTIALFTVASSEWRRHNEHKLKTKKSNLTIKKKTQKTPHTFSHCECRQTLQQAVQRGFVISILFLFKT